MQMEQPEDREQVINVIDEITDDFSIVIKWIFNKIQVSIRYRSLIFKKLDQRQGEIVRFFMEIV